MGMSSVHAFEDGFPFLFSPLSGSSSPYLLCLHGGHIALVPTNFPFFMIPDQFVFFAPPNTYLFSLSFLYQFVFETSRAL